MIIISDGKWGLLRCDLINLQWVFILRKQWGRRISNASKMDYIYVSQHSLFITAPQITAGRSSILALWAESFGGIVVPAQKLHLSRNTSGLHSENFYRRGVKPCPLLGFTFEITHGDLWSPVSPSHPRFPFLSSTICCFWRWALTWNSRTCSVGCAAQSD